MSASERRKGKLGELEVVHLMRAAGWPAATRTSDGRGQCGRGDISGGPTGFTFEVRRREQLALWASLAGVERDAGPGCVPVLVFRRSRSRWWAAVPFDSLLELLTERSDRGSFEPLENERRSNGE